MKNKNYFWLLIISIYSCREIIEPNIESKNITILAPADGYKTKTISQKFWWEKLSGAEKYNLQIVNPDFRAIQQLIVDTNITSNIFNYTFLPGTYQWRIRGLNNGYSTAFTIRTLIIDTTSDLSIQKVFLQFPGENYFSNKFA